mgnify:CR=1 FL=1
MEKKKVKPAPAAVKGTPQKSAPKKRRFLLKFLFVFFLVTGLAVAGLYQRWFPLDPELDAKIDPYRTHLATAMESADSLLKKMEPLLEKVGIGTKPKEQEQVTAPQTNFPLVELDKDEKKQVTTPPGTAPSTPGAPAIASAAPLQPAGAAKPPAAGKLDPETGKVYSKLSKLYGAMKPEEAVAVFNNLEDEQVVLILSRMDEEAAAKVLATLEPKRAARLTQAMIKRK